MVIPKGVKSQFRSSEEKTTGDMTSWRERERAEQSLGTNKDRCGSQEQGKDLSPQERTHRVLEPLWEGYLQRGVVGNC